MGVSYFYLFLGCLFWVFLFPFYFIYLIKMQELEKVLNSMIKKWWKPWGRIIEKIRPWGDRQIFLDYSSEDTTNREYYKNYRELVSMESWFWQFVCQNKLLSDKVDLQDYIEDSFWFRRCPFDTNWMYRIMQSSLYSEDGLAQFLLDNIVVGWKKE